MKVTEKNPRINSHVDLQNFELKHHIKLPDNLIEFIMEYEGSVLTEDECYFEFQNGLFYELNQILYLNESEEGGASIETILGGHSENGIVGFIPFAIDSGGWDFNISLNEATFGEIWINKFDSDEENTMAFVASSLEVFIGKLGSDI